MSRIFCIFMWSVCCFISCNNEATKKKTYERNDLLPLPHDTSVSVKNGDVKKEGNVDVAINDSLNELVDFISGQNTTSKKFKLFSDLKEYKSYSENFNKRWQSFDSNRVTKLKTFSGNVLSKEIKPELLIFYPFSGPDILYANIFFPDAEKYVMIGLEPVGTFPKFNSENVDSLKPYFTKLNSSLNAILKFSFFRTESMKKDLRNKEVDGTLHLLSLFLNRLGHKLVSAKPITVDTLGKLSEYASFEKLKKAGLKTKGIEIVFLTPDNKVKTVTYFSLNVANDGLNKNKGFITYLHNLKNFNTYLKGASYLLHYGNFSIVRNVILNGSSSVVQDDSGIALRYFNNSGVDWNFKLFGKYSRPISLFSSNYQKDLDSLYKTQGSTDVGFGIGYNFKDKNSNLMVAKRK
jgi:hypothetical protein